MTGSGNRKVRSPIVANAGDADEPTGNLDEDTARGITEILKESAHKMNKCVVVVTHSEALAKEADVVFRLKRGELRMGNK